MTTAEDYIRDASLAMRDGYLGDCVAHTCRVAELLQAEGRAPWIGRLRHVIRDGERVIHGALIPKRFAGRGAPTWTTHYVGCSGRDVYDPLVGAPIDVEEYGWTVFGQHIEVETHLDVAATERLLSESSLKQSFRPAVSPFASLRAGGEALAEALGEHRERENVLVVAIVRGGVPVACEVATRLKLPLDLVMLRRLTMQADGSALCAFSVCGTPLVDDAVAQRSSDPGFAAFLDEALAEIQSRERACRAGRAPLSLAQKTILLVDNGIRTGSTMSAAIRALNRQQAARIIAAVPVASPEGAAAIEVQTELVCLARPHPFVNVGRWYAGKLIPPDENEIAGMMDAVERG